MVFGKLHRSLSKFFDRLSVKTAFDVIVNKNNSRHSSNKVSPNISTLSVDGSIVDNMSDGEMFGMVALLEGSRKRNASIKVTSQHCTVFSLKKTDILPLIDQSELKDIEDERLKARLTDTSMGTDNFKVSFKFLFNYLVTVVNAVWVVCVNLSET